MAGGRIQVAKELEPRSGGCGFDSGSGIDLLASLVEVDSVSSPLKDGNSLFLS